MKVLLVYPPFCTPTMLPYSISYLKNFLYNNLDVDVKCLDLNAKFHYLRFPALHNAIVELRQKKSYTPEALQQYAMVLETIEKEAADIYYANNKAVLAGQQPEFLQELMSFIVDEKPDLVAFSLVYSSQCFYTKAILDELKKHGIATLVGGPAVNSKIKALCQFMANEVEMVESIAKEHPALKKYDDQKGNNNKNEHPYHCDTIPDFSDYLLEEYFLLEKMVPIKTCSTCFYKQCTFCTHFADVPYLEYNVDNIRKTIVQSGAKYIFFVDDMIAKNRLLELAAMLKPLGVKWWCQLRPTKDLLEVFPELYASGLHTVSWGVESGNQRILDLMKKGTHVEIAANVLQKSHDAGIRNATYIMFGFPTETKEEFLDTITFLKQNQNVIDLVTTSIFGLQKGGKVYANPDAYGISEVVEKERTVLDKSITYITTTGMQREDARTMRRKYMKTIKNIDKLPRILNYFKEQVLLW
ncbi:radical SAM protein [Candidatus Woesearchaeota archaeon]|nr:radical SAM protein [Candidatus Woesearchaeota archaeon]